MQHDVTLEGYGIRLVPLVHRHARALAPLIDERIWRGMSSPTPLDEDDVHKDIGVALATPGRLAFAVTDAQTGEVRGSTSFYDLDDRIGRVEIGHTYYGRQFWGGVTNPAAKYLLLRQAFDEWGFERVAFRADVRNGRSLAAISRLGAVREGTLRSHRLAPDGTRADSAYFSILAGEWPAVRDGLLERLEPVDRQGRPVSVVTMPPSHVLLLGGRSGVGKTSVAHAVHALLAERDVRHAVVEGDYLDLAHPAPHEHALAERNLSSVWANYKSLGYRRLVYTNTVSVLHATALAAAMWDGPLVTSVLLTASDATARERLEGREIGDELRAHIARSDAAARRLDAGAGPEVYRVATDGRTVVEIAEDVLAATGWLD